MEREWACEANHAIFFHYRGGGAISQRIPKAHTSRTQLKCFIAAPLLVPAALLHFLPYTRERNLGAGGREFAFLQSLVQPEQGHRLCDGLCADLLPVPASVVVLRSVVESLAVQLAVGILEFELAYNRLKQRLYHFGVRHQRQRGLQEPDRMSTAGVGGADEVGLDNELCGLFHALLVTHHHIIIRNYCYHADGRILAAHHLLLVHAADAAEQAIFRSRVADVGAVGGFIAELVMGDHALLPRLAEAHGRGHQVRAHWQGREASRSGGKGISRGFRVHVRGFN